MLWWWVVGPWHLHVFSLASCRREYAHCTSFGVHFTCSEIEMWRQLSSPREPGRIEFPSRPVFLLIYISFPCYSLVKSTIYKEFLIHEMNFLPPSLGTILCVILGRHNPFSHYLMCRDQNSTLLGTIVLIPDHDKNWDMGYSFSSVAVQGCIWKVTSAIPRTELLHWCCRLCKSALFFVYSHLLLAYIQDDCKAERMLLDAQKGMSPLPGVLMTWN